MPAPLLDRRGLTYMFHMMNEARIMVGSGGAITALCGYQYSLDYARELQADWF